MPDDLLEEERVSLGALENPSARVVGQRGRSREGRAEAGALFGPERVERKRGTAPAPASPVGPGAKQVRARRAHEEDRTLDSLGELVEDVEHRRVRPVDVL